MPSVIPTKFHTLFTLRIPRRKLEVAEVPLFSATSCLSPVFSGFLFALTHLLWCRVNPFAGVLWSYLPYSGSAVTGVGRTRQMPFEMEEERFSLYVFVHCPCGAQPTRTFFSWGAPWRWLTVIKYLHLKLDLLEMCTRAWKYANPYIITRIHSEQPKREEKLKK